MSGEGPRCRSEAATCNQERSESLLGKCRALPIPDGAVLPSAWHVELRHYLSRSQQHAADSRASKHAAALCMTFRLWAITLQITQSGAFARLLFGDFKLLLEENVLYMSEHHTR